MRGAKMLIAAAVAIIALAAADYAFAQDEDTIVISLGPGSTQDIRCKILRETYNSVLYKVGASRQTANTEDVVDVIHGDAPHGFRTGDENRKNGNWSEAIDDFKKVLNDRKDWVKAYAQFYLADSYRMWGLSDSSKLSEAVKEYEVFLSKFTDHRFVPNALYGKAQASIRAGLSSKATEAYTKLGSGNYGGKWGVVGRYGVASMTGDTAGLERVIAEAEAKGMGDIAGAARLGLAQALLKKKQYRDAKKKFEEIAKKPEGVGKEVLAAAHNGLGDCYRNLDTTEDGKKTALFEYLKVIVLYASARDEYLRALKEAIALLEDIGGEVNKKRAGELRKEQQKALGE
jgi:tetratricopeptide (TPR) repeat protein